MFEVLTLCELVDNKNTVFNQTVLAI